MIRDQLAGALRAALSTLEVTPMPATVNLERPAHRDHGDWSSNVALVAAKKAGWNPRDLAGRVAEILTADPPAHVTAVEVAGPGFVNFRLADSWLHDVLGEVVEAGVDAYARTDLGGGRRVLVEFVSANPTGPLHAGHGRGAAYGDSLARVLERTGHLVSRENYLNDRGIADAALRGLARRSPTWRATPRGRLPGPVHHRLGRPRSPRAPTSSSGARPGPWRTTARPSSA